MLCAVAIREVTPKFIRSKVIFGGVTDWYQSHGYREPGQNDFLDYNRFKNCIHENGFLWGHCEHY